MSFRIEIGLKNGVPDPRGNGVTGKARDFLGLPVTTCRTRNVYRIDVKMTKIKQKAVRTAFTDPVIERSADGRLRAPTKFDWMIEVGFKPGVTDNVGRTARVLVSDVLERKLDDHEEVSTSIQYFVKGKDLTREHAQHLAKDALGNALIQTMDVYSPEEWDAAEVVTDVPRMEIEEEPQVKTYDLSGSDEDLMRISSEGILSLSLVEMHAIRDYYLRPDVQDARKVHSLPMQPTDIELECIAQSWSEHCCHKIFGGDVIYTNESGETKTINSLFKTYIKEATETIDKDIDWLVSVFTDNAGVVKFNDHLNVVFKAETHNSPSALDPFGGAITGIVGVNRDPMGTGMGAELLCNTWGYCLGSPFYDGDLPEGLMHPRRIRDGVHGGVIDGGNQSGIPYVRGFERFDDRYIGKPLVYCGTVGTLPKNVGGRPSERKEIEPGDLAVMTGGRIGKDGIHGATFSSEELRSESPAQAVQIGDALTQRKMYEFIIEARDAGLYRCITDNGAGGLSSSMGEMATITDGLDIDLANAPLKYEGLQPWEIFLSEAQERMSLAVQPENIDAFMALAEQRDVEACVLGNFNDSGELLLRYEGEIVSRLDMSFLHGGCPKMEIPAKWDAPVFAEPEKAKRGKRNQMLRELLGRLNVCSREYKSREYDHEVKGRSVIKPFVGVNSDVPTDATVIRSEYDSNEGIIVAEGINPFFSDLDTYHMTASVIDEAVRRIISVGGRADFISGLDNFCWPDPVLSEKTPDGPYKMAQLVRSNEALFDLCVAYGVPPISGKDSMKNDSTRGGRKISIPPTLLFSTMGKIDDVRKAVTMSFKKAGDLVYVVGATKDEMGASEFHRCLAEQQGNPEAVGGQVPTVDPTVAMRSYQTMEKAISGELLHSSHTPSLGGLAAGLALASIGGGLGANIRLADLPIEGKLDDDACLFSESNSRFIVTCAPENADLLENLFSGQACARVGEVTEEPVLTINGRRGRTLVDAPIDGLSKGFKKTLDGI